MDLSLAPLTAHPLQARYCPVGGTPGTGDYGRLPISVYGRLPCDLLICEMKGPTAIAVSKDGDVLFEDTDHLGRWVETDARTGLCLVGAAGYRTVRWLDRTGALMNTWDVPNTVPGLIYGLRVSDQQMILNLDQSNRYCETWVFPLDNDGFPSGAGTKLSFFEGTDHYSRSLTIRDGWLWVTAMMLPTDSSGCQGALQAYDLQNGDLMVDHYGHFPNDVDFLPSGDVVWIDEHLDRVRMLSLATDEVTTLMGGSKLRAEYEPSMGSIFDNDLAHMTNDGSMLSSTAVEYRGLPGIYAPNGLAAITQDLFAIADTDNSRVIVARAKSTWEPEIIGVVALLNEPTKVRIIPTV